MALCWHSRLSRGSALGLGVVVRKFTREKASWVVKASSVLIAISGFLARRSEEHTSELQSRLHLVCRLLLEKKKKKHTTTTLPAVSRPRGAPGSSCRAP